MPSPTVEPRQDRVRPDPVVTAALLVFFLRSGASLAQAVADRVNLGREFAAGTLTKAQARRLLAVLRLDAEARFRNHTARLVAGEITLTAWADGFRVALVVLVAAAVQVLHRGRPLDSDQQEEFRRAANRQAGFLGRFRRGLAAGEQLLDGTAVGRAGLFGMAAWAVAINLQRDTAGHSQERRVLGSADHCRDCLSEAARGWQPAGTLRAIGDTVCRMRCGCYFAFR